MKPAARAPLAALAAASLFVALLAAITGFLLAAMPASSRSTLLHLLDPHAGLLATTVVLAAACMAGIARHLYLQHVDLADRLAEDARLLWQSSHARPLPEDQPRPLAALARVVNTFAEERRSLREDVAQKITAARASLEQEKNRLATLMAELSQSVVVCNRDGRILLYNQRARQQFQDGVGDSALIGLGRSIYDLLERGMLAHALDDLQRRLARGEAQPLAKLVTSVGGRLLRVQLAPVLAHATPSGPDMDGFILILENITRQFEQESKRDQMIHILTEGNRGALANIRAAAEMLDYSDLPDALRQRFRNVIRDEVEGMGQRLNQAADEFAGALKARWPLEEMLAQDLIDAAGSRIEQQLKLPTKHEEVEAQLWIKVDSFSLLQALCYLSSRLAEEFEVREVRLRVARAGRLAHLDLIWSGAAMSTETVMSWELEPMQFAGEHSPLTVRDIIERHDGEFWMEREKVRHRAYFRLALPIAEPVGEYTSGGAPGATPDTYDFDLFGWSNSNAGWSERPLADLAYTVFDTETTGLQPSAGDEIIQIGAVRIVNGKLLTQERFEQLIDPGRALPEASTRIHGITPDMLEGKPAITKVLPAFHAFCRDTVLVAHNAAFDMRFLQLKEESCGLHFDQPVLDTLLLSAVVHPHQDSHRLEAIAERLGVTILDRHTALGDAMVTASVFLHLIPLLAERGITTLGQARAAAEESYYARIRY